MTKNKSKLIDYLLVNGKNESWQAIADKLGICQNMSGDAKRKYCSKIYTRYLRSCRLDESLPKIPGSEGESQTTQPPSEDQVFQQKIAASNFITTDSFAKYLYNEEDVAKFFKIDTDKWEVDRSVTNTWEQGAKISVDGKILIAKTPLYQLKLTWKKKDTAAADYLDKKAEIEAAYLPKFIEVPAFADNWQNWVVIGCVHVPGHNRSLWDGVLKYIHTHKVDGVILAGDFLDMKSLSDYDKDKVQETNLWDEYLEGRKAILEIESAMPSEARRIFIYGNHEARYLKTIKRHETSRFGQALLSPEKAIGLDAWEVLTDWQNDYVLLGNDFEVFHGTITSKNAAVSHLEKSALNSHSCMFFHTHRFAMATVGKFASYNCGSLADFDNLTFMGYVDRHTKSTWQNGFGLVSVDGDGNTYAHGVKCSRKGFCLDGITYK